MYSTCTYIVQTDRWDGVIKKSFFRGGEGGGVLNEI